MAVVLKGPTAELYLYLYAVSSQWLVVHCNSMHHAANFHFLSVTALEVYLDQYLPRSTLGALPPSSFQSLSTSHSTIQGYTYIV
jgi:hypothetical protein